MNKEMITLITKCPFCGKENNVNIYFEDYLNWEAGELAQNAFPYLNPIEREKLISGICEDCQKTIF